MVNQKPLDLNALLLKAKEDIKARTRHPDIRKYKPHPKQKTFHESTKDGKLYIGGNRSGKTVGGVIEGYWRSVGRHPYRPELNQLGPTRGRVVAVDLQKGVDQIILPVYKQWGLPTDLRGGSWDKAYDKGSRILNFANGSFIEFMSYDQDLDKFAGTSRHWVHFDEEPPKPIYGECMARLVDTDGDWWMTMTPVEGMTWIYEDIYEPNVNNLDGNVAVIEINTFENPYLTESGIKKLLDSVDQDEQEIRVGGKFISIGGRVYKNFDPTVGGPNVLSYEIDNPMALFPRSHWLWIMGLDHGLSNPTAVSWVAFDRNGFGVVFDEYYHSERTIDQNARGILEICRRHGRMPDILVADPSIQNRNPVTGLSIQEEYQKYGLSFMLGDNDVKAGIVRLRKYFNPHEYVSSPHNRPAIFGGPKSGTDIRQWELDSEDRKFVRLRIAANCEFTRRELKLYRWKTYANKKLAFERNKYEEPNKKDDHLCDALRYIIMTQPDLVAYNPDAESKLDVVMNQLQRQMTENANPLGYDDPMGRFEDSTYNFNHNTVNTPAEMGWEIDEHMGIEW